MYGLLNKMLSGAAKPGLESMINMSEQEMMEKFRKEDIESFLAQSMQQQQAADNQVRQMDQHNLQRNEKMADRFAMDGHRDPMADMKGLMGLSMARQQRPPQQPPVNQASLNPYIRSLLGV